MAGFIMAGNTTYLGIQYPTSTDYVKDGATDMETIADGFDSAVAIPTYNNQTGTTYTFVLLDAAKVVSSNNAAAVTFTIPPQADVVWETGTTLTVANYGAGAVTIAAGAGVTVTNSAATVGQYSSASIIRTASDAWTVIPFAGGAALLSDSAISGTTGSPTTGTYTDGGINYKTYSFTGSGSITTTKAGLLDLLVVAGGGGSATGVGAGAGGYVDAPNHYLVDGTYTITIGAGGAAGNRGNETIIGKLTAVGGGRADNSGSGYGSTGGSSGAGTPNANARVLGQGFVGFSGAGGGGGSSGAGGATAGGIGTSNSITGAAVTYATGGPKVGGAGAANTGDGAGATAGAAGGSGIVVVRVLA